jgi:hypothetical protein
VRISSEIRRIEVEETAGELGALLKEARLVKELLPLHNHRLRRKMNAVFLRMPDLRSPPEIVANKDIDWAARGEGAETLFGPFATKQHVKQMLENLAGEQGLCWRSLGWEKRGGPCFARQVGKCRGACIGEETPESHNVRLATALAPHRLLDWPFEGRIIVREANPESGIEGGPRVRAMVAPGHGTQRGRPWPSWPMLGSRSTSIPTSIASSRPTSRSIAPRCARSRVPGSARCSRPRPPRAGSVASPTKALRRRDTRALRC